MTTLACSGGSTGGSGETTSTEATDEAGDTQAEDESGGDGDTGDTGGTEPDPDVACSAFYLEGENIDECAVDNGGCGEGATCIDQPGAPAACQLDVAADLTQLLEGVPELGHELWAASGLILTGRRAFAIIGDNAGPAVVAASEVGQGRVVAWGDERFLTEPSGSGVTGAAALTVNAVRWAGRSDAPSVGVAAGMGELLATLQGAGLSASELGPESAGEVDVYIPNTSALDGDSVNLLREWTNNGGGLLVAGSALTSGPYAYPGVGLLWDAGILTSGHDGRIDSGLHTTSTTHQPLHNSSWAAQQLRAHVAGELTLSDDELNLARRLTDLTTEALTVPEFPDYFCSAERFADAVGPIIPTEDDPIEQYLEPTETLALRVDHRIGWGRPALQVRAHESTSYHPGVMPEGAETLSRTLTIDGNYAGRDPRYVYANPESPVWRGTGLYAAPGEAITVTASGIDGSEGLELQIGIHDDLLWDKDAWQRMPEMVRRGTLRETTLMASPYGGPVFIRVPVGASLGDIEVTIEGAYPAPRFILGETSNQAWIDEERPHLAPWAELESAGVIFSVPREIVAELDEPQALMELWMQFLDADAVLAGIDPERERPERFVFDHQISAGLLHSGYPIMGLWSTKDSVVDRDAILANGEWGPLHELGHNHQWREWNLPGTTEGHVNLWSVYTSEEVLGISRDIAHEALDPDTRAARIQAYLDGGANFEADWSVWTCLETYLQLQEAFGWEPYSNLFANYYQAVPVSETWNTQERIDNFALSFAQEVQRDLGPFFTSWGFPLSQSVLDEMAMLPVWAENPMP